MTKKQTSSVIKKLVSYVPRTEEEMKSCVKATIDAQLECEKLIADRDKATIAAAEPFADRISALQTQQARNLELLEAYSEINREAFGKDKSIVVEGHRMGWKLGNWKTELKSKVKWDSVVGKLRTWINAARPAVLPEDPEECVMLRARAAKAKKWLAVKLQVAPDKSEMIASRTDEEAKKLLTKLGVEIVQEESFYLAPDRDGQDPALLTTAE